MGTEGSIVTNLRAENSLTGLFAAGERKETRGLHARPEYPFKNPLFNGFHIIKKIDGKPVTAWREKRYERSQYRVRKGRINSADTSTASLGQSRWQRKQLSQSPG